MTTMQLELSKEELGLVIGALEFGSKELREGQAASARLRRPMPHGIDELAGQMDSLLTKLLNAYGQEPPTESVGGD